jgi:hypothetical protein
MSLKQRQYTRIFSPFNMAGLLEKNYVRGFNENIFISDGITISDVHSEFQG